MNPDIVCHGHLGCFGFRYQLHGHAGFFLTLTQRKGVLQKFRGLVLDDFAANVDGWPPVLSWTDPTHVATGFEICLEFSTHEESAVGLRRDKALPHLLRSGGDIEDELQWQWLGHVLS